MLNTNKTLQKEQLEIKDPYKKSRIFAIIEAALEYFISIMVGTTYLAKLSMSIGLSDSVTGILSSFISLGTGFQIFALLFAHKKRLKPFLSISFMFMQTGFALLYVVPVVDLSPNVKSAVFIVLLLVVEILKSVIYPAQMKWFYSVVDDRKRGSFTAVKEIVSLLSGIAFTFVLGRTIDHFEAKGELNTAFILCGIGIFVLMLLHTATLIFIKEKRDPEEVEKKSTVLSELKAVATNKKVLKIIPIFILTNIAHYVVIPFYGTYQLKDLGFTMTFVAVLSFIYAIVRSVVSVPMGKLADKYGFATMLTLCDALMIVAFSMNMFFGKGFYIAYYIVYAVAMAGKNSCAVNLLYDYVPHSQRTGAIAIKNTIAGFIGFFTTLAVTPLVTYIQANGNKFLFLENVCAQQVLSFISVVVTLILVIYLNAVVRPMKKEDV